MLLPDKDVILCRKIKISATRISSEMRAAECRSMGVDILPGSMHYCRGQLSRTVKCIPIGLRSLYL